MRIIFSQAPSQGLTISANNNSPCKGEEVTYTANWEDGAPAPSSCLTYYWNISSGNTIISGQGTRTLRVRWNSTGSKTVNVSADSEFSGGGGGGPHSPGAGDYTRSYDQFQNCPFVSATQSKSVTVGDPGSGSISASQSSYMMCQGDQVTLTATTSGDATSGWLGWYNSSGVRISTSKTTTVSQPGTYQARASIGDPGCSSIKSSSPMAIIGPVTYSSSQLGRIFGDRTVYAGKQVSGSIKLINTSAPIEKWMIKRGSDQWRTYQNTNTKNIDYTDTFNETTLIRALIDKDCPEQPNQYTPTVTINVVEYIPDYHSITSTSYDNNGPISKSAQYFDDTGKALQSQSWSPEENEVFASEPLYDNYDRAVGQTLSAPIGRNEISGFKSDFATKGGEPLTEAEWGAGTPQGVDKNTPNTLGYYYSSNNTTDGGLIPETNHPYAVSSFYDDGSGEQKSSSQPGDFHFLKSGNNAIQKVLPVFDGELRHYAPIRNLLVGQGVVPDRLVKQVVMDANGNEAIVYQNESGNTIASAISGGPKYATAVSKVNTGNWIEVHIPKGQERSFSTYQVVDLVSGDPVSGMIGQGFYKMKKSSGTLSYKPTYTNFTYNFYDNKGRLVASMTPKGTQQIIDQGGLGTISNASDLPYTTLYTYDFQGRLTSMTEPDAGTTRYKYRKDGQIRYSMNADQTQGRYSYTDYDGLGRPIESGEITTGTNFDSANPDTGLPSGTKSDWIKTYYDVAMLPSLPAEFSGEFALTQEFISGAVSSTESEEVQSWYSYDEQGRVSWFLQYYKDLDKYFLMQYEYDFLGNVTKVGFQPQTYGQTVSEAYWHYYTYNKNQRLKTVETSVKPDTEKYLHATYEYYTHGPLKRVVLADDMQGIDYTYTPQGWLKAINHPVRDLDPGKDGIANNVHKDFFGMSLEYFEGDYATANSSIGSLDLDDNQVPQQYNGNIRAMVFGEGSNSGYSSSYKQAKFYNYPQTLSYNSTLSADLNKKAEQSITLTNGFNSNGKNLTLQVKPDVPASQRIVDLQEGEVYAYEYDEKYQLKKADYTKDGSETNTYDVSVDGYDENGNIAGIERYGEDPNALRDDFAFTYYPNTNRLKSVSNYITNIDYNDIGQVTGITYHANAERPNMQIFYNVTGKVTAVVDPDSGEPVIEFAYDDRGFRMMKKVGDIEEWYVRDASGQVMAIYNKMSDTAPIAQIELPIYGATKLGMAFKNPDHYKFIYELTDHLGNVRALATKLGLMATATMESENDAYERQYFDNLSVRQLDVANSYRGSYSAHTHPGEPIGPTTTLRVQEGDQINLEVFFKEGGTSTESPTPFGLEDLLQSSANDAVVGVEGGLLSNAVGANVNAILSAVTTSSSETRAYLQYILFDESFNVVGDGAIPVEAGTAAANGWKHLSISDEVTQDGYIYAYLVNESDKDLYWDDFTFSVLGTRMIRSTDYYPFGSVAKQWSNPDQTQRESYRHSYQGQYSETDTTTGWQSFELRMYDPLIGRWLAIDPYGQYASGYLGMGNNPISMVDPDGGFGSKFQAILAWIGGGFSGRIDQATGGDRAGEFFISKAAKFSGEGVGVSVQRQFDFSRGDKTFAGHVWNSPTVRDYTGDLWTFSFDTDFHFGVGGSQQQAGIVIPLRGPEAFTSQTFQSASMGGGVDASMGLTIGKLWYSGSANQVRGNRIEGGFSEVNGGVSVGIELSKGSIMGEVDDLNNHVHGITLGIGGGAPSIISGNTTTGTTRIVE
ncbi:RHS repeat-associated core domain-containing protein [Ekhidna sp.]|uniref:RHS repeat-associated core domain-containing protein n=1 Tax=Ekhidna sp. TaxID=2608089 RepID=UPI0032EB5949